MGHVERPGEQRACQGFSWSRLLLRTAFVQGIEGKAATTTTDVLSRVLGEQWRKYQSTEMGSKFPWGRKAGLVF